VSDLNCQRWRSKTEKALKYLQSDYSYKVRSDFCGLVANQVIRVWSVGILTSRDDLSQSLVIQCVDREVRINENETLILDNIDDYLEVIGPVDHDEIFQEFKQKLKIQNNSAEAHAAAVRALIKEEIEKELARSSKNPKEVAKEVIQRLRNEGFE